MKIDLRSMINIKCYKNLISSPVHHIPTKFPSVSAQKFVSLCADRQTDWLRQEPADMQVARDCFWLYYVMMMMMMMMTVADNEWCCREYKAKSSDVLALQQLKQCHDRRIELDTHAKRLDSQITDDCRRIESCMWQFVYIIYAVSETRMIWRINA